MKTTLTLESHEAAAILENHVKSLGYKVVNSKGPSNGNSWFFEVENGHPTPAPETPDFPIDALPGDKNYFFDGLRCLLR